MKILTRTQSISAFAICYLMTALATTGVTAANEKVVHAFRGGNDGAMPYGGLVADMDGNLYGGTEGGGTGTQCYGNAGCGTLFKIANDGGETILYSFQGGSDGISPFGSLLVADTGNIYGVTGGGAGTGCAGFGCGTVFEYMPNGTETVLYAFQGGSDGLYPQGGLVMDEGGNLYGMTGQGGNYNGTPCENSGCGTIFEVQPGGNKITLHAFQSGSDGAFPNGGLIEDVSGNFYGSTTSGGGSGCNDNGCGTVFKLTPDGTENVLYAFQGNSDGMYPMGSPIADSAGNFYGTTLFGGASGEGVVFKVSPDGQETVLHSFSGGHDGANPEAGLVMDEKGNLYGTTFYGGGTGCKQNRAGLGCGTVFKVTSKGKETVLSTFRKNQGTNPQAALLLGPHNDLYGTTPSGGKYKNGVVFKLKK